MISFLSLILRKRDGEAYHEVSIHRHEGRKRNQQSKCDIARALSFDRGIGRLEEANGLPQQQPKRGNNGNHAGDGHIALPQRHQKQRAHEQLCRKQNEIQNLFDHVL